MENLKSKAELLPPLVIEIENLKSRPHNVELFSRSIISDAVNITVPTKYTRFDGIKRDGSVSMKQDKVLYSDVLAWVNQHKPRITKLMAVYDTPELLTKTGFPLADNIWVNSSDIFGYTSTFSIELKRGLVDNKLVGEVTGNGFELNMYTTIFIPFAKRGKITLYLYRD